ncbi:protein POOR HOMOLOGOUS SYNAPSIS 1 [Quillaja saponaria]|uniref:Protein POOR HOMOLOGOUS SYNAPSIS 1 n=1 Tax=Quillaja saponaria TaxID=32244 RepID=A0AAD7L8K1_QUISA|nr:protein POOR HOMOLOGOUS SYNAPSIS 1 [Quillaja saponaria]
MYNSPLLMHFALQFKLQAKRLKERGEQRRPKMAGTLAVIPSNAMMSSTTAIGDQWEIYFSRFFNYPPVTSTCTDLIPLPSKVKNRRPKGTWISSSSTAFLRLVDDQSSSDVILTVCFRGKILEEHCVSKLHFSWPQVSCVSGFPARGIRAVLVSYRDSVGEIQKFALRFSSIYETETFINALKEIFKVVKGTEPLNSDYASEISSQSEFMSSNKNTYRACEELTTVTPIDTYTPQMPPSLGTEVEHYSSSQEKKIIPTHDFEGISQAFPPSFTSLITNYCSDRNQASAQSTFSNEIDLKSQIARYMEDSSFQDMLLKVERVISEIGGDMSL